MERDRQDKQWNEAKKQNHQNNIQHLTGFYHGTFYQDGRGPIQRPEPEESVNLYTYDRFSRLKEKGKWEYKE